MQCGFGALRRSFFKLLPAAQGTEHGDSMSTTTIGYRADIDGLRAVAVLSVILYHINHSWVPGGYVGVDIFFVISGFLITRNIATELSENRFTLTNFYLRRIRRIAPAFLLVTMVTVIAGMILLLPDDMVRLAKSAIWATFSAANIYFWKYLDTSYFAAATAQEPLLHMWSLGVEEQFYLLWPVLLLMLSRFRGKRALFYLAALAICIGSFCLAEATNVDAPKFSYYMLPTRAGELMIGALLALLLLSDQVRAGEFGRNRLLCNAISLGGLGLMAYSFWMLDDSSPFPGVNAVYPSVGAALVILGGNFSSWANRVILTSKPVVFIGLISYSMYLWHWPILAYFRYFFGEISIIQGEIALGLTLLLSMASYKLVEQPARRIRLSGKSQFVALWAVPAAGVALAGAMLIYSHGMKATIERSAGFHSRSATLEQETAPANRSRYPCMDPRAPLPAALSDPKCVFGAPVVGSVRPDVFVWGDSNAGHYLGVLDAISKSGGFTFRYLALSSCPALFGNGPYGASYLRDRCDAFRAAVRLYLERADIKTVVLASQWAVHAKGAGGRFDRDMEATISELIAAGKHVVILGQVPGFPRYNKDCLLRWARIGQSRCKSFQSSADIGDFPTNLFLESLAGRTPNVSYLNVRDVLCEDDHCSPYVEGIPVYFNTTHLSAPGSELIGKTLLKTANGPKWRSAFEAAEMPVPSPSGNPVPTSAKGTVVLGNIYLNFPNMVRSTKDVKSADGTITHRVAVEYIGVDHRALVSDLRKVLSNKGYALRGPTERAGVYRYIIMAGDMQKGKMAVSPVGPSLQMKLYSSGAKGVALFVWKED